MAISRKRSALLGCLLAITSLSMAQSATNNEIDFISDTQQPMAVEKVKLRPNHNIKATSLLLADMLRQKPLAIYMLGDVVGVGSSNLKWRAMDRFLASCRKNNISVHALLGNHDVMWSRRKGELNFQHRFPDNVDVGYVSIIDSIAIVMLNSNFRKLSAVEIDKQQRWYTAMLQRLNGNDSIRTIIVSCHHAPYTNSRIVGSSLPVRRYFVPAFIQTAKCKLFITGHAHAFEHFKYSGKDFLVIGGGGGLHQPLDTSAKSLPDIACTYKPMFHYLSVQRTGDRLLISSHFLKPDFSGVDKGYSFELSL
ncbi:MAG TPA: metallophosphoesterase [Puia sp.]|nr:metallophosphoesterase [Puia sp.]